MEIQHQHKAKPEHYDQTVLYLHLDEIDIFHIFYIGRDNAYRTLITIEKSNETLHRFNNLLSRFQAIEYCLANNHLPNREYRTAIKAGQIVNQFQKNKIVFKTDWQCNYCSFRDECWKAELLKYHASDNFEMYK